jgi:hypothetical protein
MSSTRLDLNLENPFTLGYISVSVKWVAAPSLFSDRCSAEIGPPPPEHRSTICGCVALPITAPDIPILRQAKIEYGNLQ